MGDGFTPRVFRPRRKNSAMLVSLLAVSTVAAALVLAFAAPAGAQALTPQINNLVPEMGPVGTPVAINGAGFGPVQGEGYVTFNGIRADTIYAWSDNNIVTEVPEQATTGPVVVHTLLGSSNGVEFDVWGPSGDQTWYLAEGSTAHGFDTYILMENTTDLDATVSVVYNTERYGRLPRPQDLNVPPNSRVTLHVNEEVPYADVSTELSSSQPIVCERSMYWNDRIDGHDSIGVTETSNTWYLAEGCTHGGFETWVCLQNPGYTDAVVDVTYMMPFETRKKEQFTLSAGQRFTIDVARDVGACDVSTMVESTQPIVAERSMYWDERRGGHDSKGVTGPSDSWYLAEGSTAWGFDTWLLLQNPTEDFATVDVTYMTQDGPVQEPTLQMPPRSRQSILVNDSVSNMDTSIEVASDKEIIAERSMYWDNGTGKAGHDTVGVTSASETVYLAEGSTAWGFETFVCIQNPNDTGVRYKVTYMTNEGPVETPERTLAANTRTTIKVNDELPNKDCSTRVQASLPVMAERSMYWQERGGGHVSIGWMR